MAEHKAQSLEMFFVLALCALFWKQILATSRPDQGSVPVSLSLSGWRGNEVMHEEWFLCDLRSFYTRTSILFAKLKLVVSQ